MFRIVKKITLAGLGLQARANEIVDEWVKEGERNQRKEAKWVKDVLARLEKDTVSLDEKLSKACKKTLSVIDLASREELTRLSKKVDDLISHLEQTQGAKRG
jgi:polyhydroxyalkanoate synthesis regulator phasin